MDFAYTNPVDLAKATSDATPLASAGAADLLVQYPDVNATDFGQPRIVSQSFRVATGGDRDATVGRKALFQNSVCWLLRCSYCPLIYLILQNSGVPASVNVGDEFTYDLTVANNGECIASATIVTNRLPAGLGLIAVAYNQGIATEYNAEDRTLVWRVGSVVSGTGTHAILSLTVRALQPGLFKDSACAVANYELFSESNCTEFNLRIEGTTPPEPPILIFLRMNYGSFQLRLTGQQGGTYRIQTSSDLRNWLSLTNAPGPLFYLELPGIEGVNETAILSRALVR